MRIDRDWFVEQMMSIKEIQGDYTSSSIPKCTCEDCKMINECEYAWDIYNTNGDCLASK